MDRSLCGFILRYSKRDQMLVVPLVVASMVVYYLSLDLPKTIINQAIQGVSFPTVDSVKRLLGFDLHRVPYLLALSILFLGLIVVNGWLKFQINTMKGWMGERMLRRLRFSLFDYILRFPLTRFRRVKPAEMATMIKDEVEPLGGFIGEALITPLFLGGKALTAMFFIMYQHLLLGLIALAIVGVQAFIIPKLRKRQLVLGRERQLTARALAGRIAEVVEGAAEIHAHDTSNYERAEISARLGRIFRIRFDLYQRKFMVKFLNNFLAQVTPFLFYTLGGYRVIVGKLDIGALVAVIAAYKDLPAPVKELIDWDQQRMDVEIKYNQVVEQFATEEVAAPELQAPAETPPLPSDGRLKAARLSLIDDGGTRVVDEVSFECGMNQHIAICGRQPGGASELAQMLARLVPPTSGVLELGGVDLTRAPEAMTGRALAYVGSPAYLFPVSVRENILYGLKHRPLRDAGYEEDVKRERDAQLKEAGRTGNSTLDINADWIDYGAAGVAGPQEMDARIVELLSVVDLEETIFELFSGLPPGHEFFAQYSFIRQDDLPQYEAILQRAKEVGLKDLDETERRALISLPFKLIASRHRLGLIDESFEARVVEARRYFAAHLPAELKRAIEFFDPGAYNTAASLQDNILFGKIITAQAEAATRITAQVRELLDELGLRPLVVTIGLDYQVGVGGARLPVADRQKIALVRALLKRPAMLVVDQALSPLDPNSQQRVLDGILAERKGRGIAWVLSRPDLAERFNVVLVMEKGKLAEQGAFAELKSNGGPLHKLLAAA